MSSRGLGDVYKRQIQNITVPVVMPQVESALADLQEIFLTGYPIFGVVAPPGTEAAMEQMETQIGENSIRAAWPLELLKAMRDGLKYDLGAVEVCWETKKTFTVVTAQEADISRGAAQETLYSGNYIRLSLIHISEPTRRHHVSRMPSSA